MGEPETETSDPGRNPDGAKPEAGASRRSDHAGGPPRPSDIYRRIVAEVVEEAGLGAAFAEGLERRFLDAPAAACSAAIGRWLLRRLRALGWSHEELARRVGVDRSAVTRWIRGDAMTIRHLAVILMETGGRPVDLDVPGREELALAAYLAAVTHARREIDARRSRPESQPLDPEQFWCLFHLLSEPHWERAIRRKDPRLLREESARILRLAAERLGREPRSIRGPRDLMNLVAEWMEPWVVCLAHLTPRSWPLR